MNKRLTILVSAYAMWGSVEWILPVCKYLRDNYSNIDIVFLTQRIKHNDLFKDNHELKGMVEEVSSNRCYDLSDITPIWIKSVSEMFRYLDKKIPGIPFGKTGNFWFNFNWNIFGKTLLKRWVASIRPDVALVDSTNGYLLNALNEATVKTGFYPTATSFAFSPDIYCDNWASYQTLVTKGYDTFDFYLVDTEWRSDFFKKIAGENPVFKIGPPRFDTYWMGLYKEKTGQKAGDLMNNAYKRNILILLKNESSLVFQYTSFEKALHEIIQACLTDKDTYITIKPHPRQNHQLLDKVLRQYSQAGITISHDSSFLLINRADIVISMPSGVILSALIMEKPVIEYFNFSNLNNVLQSKPDTLSKGMFGGLGCLDSNGSITSIHRKLGLVQPADKPEELELLITKFRNESVLPEVKDIRHLFPDGACKKASEVILSML